MDENQQREIGHLQDFVNRFRAKASKDTQAQSKLKQIDRMEKIEAPTSGDKHKDYGVNAFVDASTDRLSTFAIDVDTGLRMGAGRLQASGTDAVYRIPPGGPPQIPRRGLLHVIGPVHG